jgi:hypothetical protein
MRLSILLLFLIACNPVKQVLKDKEKLDKVAEVVVKSGYCANDTTIITKSDTTIKYDTSYLTDTLIDLRTIKDTQYVTLPKKVITRTITIRDTITNVVVDGARVLLLEKDVNKYKTEAAEWKELAKARWWYLFWIILFSVVYLLRKPILRICLPMLR